jgi:hypothetical protein
MLLYSGPNPIASSERSTEDRLREVAEILATGFIRLKQRKSSPLSLDSGESSVDFTPAESGHALHSYRAEKDR